MHLKESRAQACCPLGGGTVDFKRVWCVQETGSQGSSPDRVFQDNMKNAEL